MSRKLRAVDVPAGEHLVNLREALAIFRIGEATYHRHPEVLPPPIKIGNRLKFLRSEIDARLTQLAAAREAAE